METPITVHQDSSNTFYSVPVKFAKPSQTKALVETSEIYDECFITANCSSSDSSSNRQSTCLIQSGLTTTDETVVEEEGERQETITFNDKSASVKVEASPIEDESMYDGFSANVDLATYLSRPVLIHTINWSDGALMATNTIRPWRLYFQNSSITRKLQNYAFLACNLKIKVVINASPFYYGYAFCTYRPFVNNNAGYITMGQQSFGGTLATTCRQRIDILPSKSQGGEMLLPYINVRNWLRIGKLDDFSDMGELVLWSHDVLAFANAAAGPTVTVQIFAWADDVKVSGPTSELPLQADEYEETGPISGIASNVASVAGTAADLLPAPFKPFAKATEIGASAVSSIAKLFGFTNVPVIDDVSAFKNLPFHAMASTQISVPFEKLTVDPKNELTVDNRIAGGNGVDELAISYLTEKRNVWSLPNWASSDAPDAILAEINVCPILNGTTSGNAPSTAFGANSALAMTPMTLVARNFQFWRGTMVYRFKFICSQYHRGRVSIIWDPAHGTSADLNYTENYSRVVDIAEEQEIEIKVPFMQPYPYLLTNFDAGLLNITTPVASCDSFDEDAHNGRLIVKVLTKQTSPVTTADIFMYVETHMEDADFANPIDPDLDWGTRISYLPIQSRETEEKVVADNIAKLTIKKNPNLHKIYNGEAIFSMRTLFRRRCYHRTIAPTPNSTGTLSQFYGKINRRPIFYGFDQDGLNTAQEIVGAGTYQFNYVQQPMQCAFEPCFVGMRGSQNWEFNLNNAGDAIDTLGVGRYIAPITASEADDFTYTTSTNPGYIVRTALTASRFLAQAGCALTNMRTQTGLQVQVPMYSRFRFIGTNPDERNLGRSEDGSDIDNIVMTYRCVPTAGQDPKNMTLDLYTSVGTDYQLLHFVNVPNYWVYGALPTAV
jgi:hypothetical protein